MGLYNVVTLLAPVTMTAVGSLQINGSKFTVEEEVIVDLLGYWWNNSASERIPTALSLWQMTSGSGGTLLRSVAVPSSPGTQGWKDLDIDPVTLSPGITYEVAGCSSGSGNYPISTDANLGAPDYPFVRSGSNGFFTAGSCAAPATSSGSGHVVYRVGISGSTPPDPGGNPTNLSIENALVRWFSEGDDNTRQGELPYLTHLLSTAINGAVVETKDMVEALVAIGIGVKLGDAQAALDGLEAFLYSVAPDSLKTYLDGLGAGIRGTGNPTIADTITAINNIPTGGGGLPAGPVSVANGWTMRETVSGVGKIKWDEPADAYILVRTGWDADRQINVYEDVTYFFDRGWWAPQQADVIEGYGTLAAATHLLRVATGRMSGVLIVQDDDFAFDLQAWDAPSGS